MDITQKDINRFYDKIAIDFAKPDDCWLWQASLDSRGKYGQIGLNGKSVIAHRLSYRITYGPFDYSLFVCHRCDNPRCVNPTHLWLGTCADNNKDRDIKGRHFSYIGEEHNHAKLTEEDVLAIRDKYEPGVYSMGKLARDYGVHKNTIQKIIRRTNWKHI